MAGSLLNSLTNLGMEGGVGVLLASRNLEGAQGDLGVVSVAPVVLAGV